MRFLLAAILTLAVAGNSVAQSDGPDYAAWDTFASSVETALGAGTPTDTYLYVARDRLVAQRDTFRAAQSIHAPRLATLADQRAALGPPPKGGRRGAARTCHPPAPRCKGRWTPCPCPAFARRRPSCARGGIIAEIDAILAARQTRALLQLGPSPLNPTHWPTAFCGPVDQRAENHG